ncbi:hypothetical protein SPI_05826 [Niveomyces insectorum RCEF 264]|uniref:Uncharacterized protein n=1 Tax=Niveomyces insectorum RCEF 264 TaxID=1081102 RepID=A0A167SHA2_9HYPO|nr:hypothetical protein SPI_05826 [Niveomyces insectorum RCEF 264]
MAVTRQQTGNARPRLLVVLDTKSTVTRKMTTSKPKGKAVLTMARAAKPTGVTKKTSRAKDAAKRNAAKATKTSGQVKSKVEKSTEETTTAKKAAPTDA